jgi:general secretion pathway protein G
MVIIDLLADYVASQYLTQVEAFEANVARAYIDIFEKALETYRLDNSKYRTFEQDLTDLLAGSSGIKNRQGSHFKNSGLRPMGKGALPSGQNT